MTKLGKSFVILTVAATLFGAGSAFAVKTLAPAPSALASDACPNASGPTAALTFDTRWNGLWQPVGSELSRLSWVNCSSGWEFGFLDKLDLSTLPIMR